MEEVDYIVRSFHPAFIDVSWLEARFKEFCSRKYKVDMTTTMKRLKHAPYHAKVIHKLFGRDSSTSKVLLYHDKETFDDYMKLITRNEHHPHISMSSNKGRVAQASVLTGVLSDAMGLVESVRWDTRLYIDVLTLFEIVHMTYLCKDEYVCNTNPNRRWIVDYICEMVSNVTSYKCSFSLSTDSDGLLTESLLRDVRCILLTCLSPMKQPSIITVLKDEEKTSVILDAHAPLSSSFVAYHSKMKGRTIIGRNETRLELHTTNNSPISSTIARPMPDTLLPACTGSMLTRIEETDI